jgi:hypothetical protein
MLVIAACMVTVPAAARNLSYDCDTTADRYSEITTALTGAGQISGIVTPMRVADGERHLTSARIGIDNPKDGSWVGFWLYRASSASPDTFKAVMVVSRAGKDDETMLGTVKLEQAIPFRVALGEGGAASLELGEWKHTVSTALRIPAMATVSCSTGEFKFESLDFDR